ncbi:MAG TPA: phosphoribosyltransferase family protein [Bryobacteraceae bacterium]|nr:phosphoribosyltransferase family protein [Bryobacteraceae bacterium]
MHFIPTVDEIIPLLRDAGALRDGHFEYSNGLHTDQHIETALAMRSYRTAKILSVALSRLLRANSELRAWMPDVSIVAATPAGLPVAFGLAEVLKPKQVYWAEKEDPRKPMRFEITPAAGEHVILADDILRSGQLLNEAKGLLESQGAIIVGLAVLLHQPTPQTVDFGALPIYALARLEAHVYTDSSNCDLCRRGVKLDRIGMDWKAQDLPEAALVPAL